MNSSRDIKDYTEKYLEAPFLKENNWYRKKALMEQFEKYQPQRILEIGCGIFPLFDDCPESFLESVTKWVIIEPSTDFIKNAKDKIKEKNLEDKIDIKQGFFEDVVLKDDFDFIICSSLLHEINDPKAMLKAIYNTCTPETIVHINVPNAFSMHRIIALLGGMIEDVHDMSNRNVLLQQREVYDLDSLINQVEEMGFNVIDKGSYFIKPFTHGQMDRMMKENIINQKVLDGLYKLIEYFPEYGSEIFVNIQKADSAER